jgi:phage baseplate assembly protein V
MIVIGQVSTSDKTVGSVRVVFPDRDDLVSGELPVITRGGWGRGNAVPQPGETVLCVFLNNSRSSGYCLGTYYGSEDKLPGTADQHGIWFEDGSYVYYDRATKTLNLKAASGVQIDGNLKVTGTITSGG